MSYGCQGPASKTRPGAALETAPLHPTQLAVAWEGAEAPQCRSRPTDLRGEWAQGRPGAERGH